MLEAGPQTARFLVADDEQGVLESYKQILNGAPTKSLSEYAGLGQSGSALEKASPAFLDDSINLECVCCQQGDEAVAAVRDSVGASKPFAAAFLDVRMPPGPDGVWTAERIRMWDPHIHIVMVTAYSDYDPEDIARRVPPSDRLLYIHKPFHVVEIRRFIWALSAKWWAEALSRQMQAQLRSTNQQLERDIGARQQAEEQLARSEARYRSLTENLSDVIIQVSPEGIVEYCSPAATRVGGFDPADVVGSSIDRYIPERDHGRVGEAILRALQSKEPESLEFTLIHASGQEFPVEVTAFPIVEQDQVATLQCVIRDITERKQTEEELRRSEASLAQAQRIAHLGNWDWDIQKNELLWSDEVYRIFGLEPQEFGASYDAFLTSVHSEDREFVRESVDRALSGEESYSIDHHVVLPDGSERIVHGQAEVSYDQTGQPSRMVGTVQDITQWKRAEEERELLEQQLFQAQKLEALGTLAGGVAHDFNNLLTAIIGMTELALRHVDPDSKAHAYLARIPEQGQSAAQLISSLMAFSRRTQSERRPLPLLPLVKEIGKVLKRLLPANIDVVVKWPQQVPVVRADPTQMQQVIMNLATNAQDAMPDGGKLTIEVANVALNDEYCRQHADATPGDYVCLTVCDSGIGMIPEVQQRIFEPFFTTKGTGDGTGLGLAMVYGIVKNHSGFVHFYSEVGTGTEFRIYLPVAEEQTCADEEDVAEDTPCGEETLLLVEDDPAVLTVGKAMLESLGYSVMTATNGQEGLEVYRAHQDEIALVVTDLTMPKMSGMALYKAIAALNPAIKVLLISGYRSPQELSELSSLGLQGFVPKPFNLEGLGKAVRQALDNDNSLSGGEKIHQMPALASN